MLSNLAYTIVPADVSGHYFDVELVVRKPAPEGQLFAMPAWIPGSYMIREFARHVVSIAAHCRGKKVDLVKIDKHTWAAAPVNGSLAVSYRVYAWDLSVRGAHLDQTHGFFNGSSVFLRVLGQDNDACTMTLKPPAGAAYRQWRVATSMPAVRIDARGFGLYRAGDYEESIDHPFEMGTFTSARFRAGGASHEVVITGRHDADMARITADLTRICNQHIGMFEPETRKAPVKRYVFMTTVVGEGYGGLEHRASTALICNRGDLPYKGLEKPGDGYRQFLGLASHEYFHTWNVKRIRPQAFARIDLDVENYTHLLWVFEGFTSYYDDLALIRCGLIERGQYLKSLANSIGTVARNPGSRVQSVSESSFDAWTKYYRQDENSTNAIVSYYVKGSLVALLLDLTIRAKTAGRRSLDDVMRLLWEKFGKRFDRDRAGVEETAMPALILEATGVDLHRELSAWTTGTQPLPLARAFEPFGLRLAEMTSPEPVTLGIKTAQRGSELAVTAVVHDGPAWAAGIAAGDTLIAMDGLRVNENSLKAFLLRKRPRQVVELTLFRRDELMTVQLELKAPGPAGMELIVEPRAGARANRLRDAWLGQHES